jgi:hypothetical protein
MLVPLRTLWVNEALGLVAQELGEERVFEYWRAYAYKRLEQLISQTPFERFKGLVMAHSGLGSEIRSIEETQDSYVLTIDPCGSIGAARRQNMIRAEHCTKKKYEFLWNKENVPYYCVHCAFVGDVVPREKLGKAFWLQDWPDDPKGVCRYSFLK